MLKATNLSHRYPDGLILDQVSFVLNDGEKLGLIGPNGSGKSTLLRILAGHLRPTGGSLQLGPGERIGYLEQYPASDLARSVGELLAQARPQSLVARQAMERAAEAMATAGNAGQQAIAMAAYSDAMERFEQLGGYESEHQQTVVLAGLGLAEIDSDRQLSSLSGGQKTRVALARLLLQAPTILLLDEPTNYLDLPALLWLERFIATSPCAAIIVSHDRRFLDRTISGILALDSESCRLTRYGGTYSDFAEMKRREQERYVARYQDQVERIISVEREIGALKGKATVTESSTIHFHYRKVAKGVARRAKVQERRLERFLTSEARLERPEEAKQLYLKDMLSGSLGDDRLAIAGEELSVSFGAQQVLTGVSLAVHGGDRLALVGANGSGKSTLLRVLAGQHPATGRRRVGDGVRLGYLSQEHGPPLAADQTVLQHFRAGVALHEDEARAFLDKFLFSGQEVHRRLSQLSYGERAKLALAGLVASGANMLLLDEPTSHLDLPSVERIELALAAYPGPLIVASHDRHFLNAIGVTGLLCLAGGRLSWLPDLASYEATLLS